MIDLSSQAYTCSKPLIRPDLKHKDITTEDGAYTSVYPKDFIAPIGTIVMNLTDEFHKDAGVSCVLRPSGVTGLNLTQDVNGEAVMTLSGTVAISLVCNIDQDHIRPLWNVLASYSDSPMKLERGSLLTGSPEMIYRYKQATTTDEDETFTEIEAQIKANPAWLMQDIIHLQLDRTTTTHTTLHIRYLSNIEMNIEMNKAKPARYGWILIKRDNQTKTEFSVLSGGLLELTCPTLGDPKPSIEWILPDGNKVRAPYSSEDQRIVISDAGKLTLKASDISDDGVYHCIATNYLDADVLSIRVSVLPQDIEESEVNGVHLSKSLGGSLFLHCESNASPPASVHWILPDHTVVGQSFGNKNLYRNGSLKIYPLNERDRGIYRCLAANHLGVDLLASQVTVLGSKAKILSLTDVQDVEGSGDDPRPNTDDVQVFDSDTASARVNQESRTITSDRPYPRLRPVPPRGLANRRGNGRRIWNRRVFDKSSRQVDPQILADFIKKSQTSKSNSPNDANESDDKEGSGSLDDSSIQNQVATTTEKPERLYGGTMFTSHQVHDYQINATPFTWVTGTKDIVSTPYSMPEVYPMEPSVTITYREFQNDDTTPFMTTQGYSDTQSDGTRYSEPLQPVTLKFTLTDTMDDVDVPFSGDTPDLDSPNPEVTPSLELPGKTLNPGALTSTDEKSQTTFTAVTATREQDEITFHTTQRIKSNRLPPGSTIISHNQIHIIPPENKHPGRRRNFPGRRRVIRPNKITDIQSFLDKLRRQNLKSVRNTTMTYTVELTTDNDIQKAGPSMIRPVTTQRGKFNSSWTEPTMQSAPIVTLPNSADTSNHGPTPGSINIISTTGTLSATTIKSTKVIKGRIPWDRLFGSKGGQREILKRLRKPVKPQTTSQATTQTTTSAPFTTTTLPKLITTLPTAESLVAPLTARPPVIQKIPEVFEISSDDFSGSSDIEEPQTDDFLILFTTTNPSTSNIKTTTTTMYKPVNKSTSKVPRVSIIPAPTTKITSTDETVESSGLDSEVSVRLSGRYRENPRPGSNRKRLRGRRPSQTKTSTTRAPYRTTSAATAVLTTPSREVTKSRVTTSSHITDGDVSQSRVFDYPGTYLTSQVPSTSDPSRIYTTPRSKIQSDKKTVITSTGLKRLPETSARNTNMNLPDQPEPQPSTVKDISGPDESTPDPEYTTTSNNVDFKVSTQDPGSKPRVVGGNAVSFTVRSNSDALLPCEATGEPKPSISWKRTSTGIRPYLTYQGQVYKCEYS